nr:MAG TPA: hypothetical protein [Caudoviricetes sp.]
MKTIKKEPNSSGKQGRAGLPPLPSKIIITRSQK